jgi:Ca-activated chloride channel homolog
MKRSLIVVIMSLPFLILNAQKETKEIRKGNREFKNAAYGEAELHYRKALENNPNSEVANYNLGNTLYKQNQFEPAITKYETLAGQETDREKLATYFYNLGNAYFKSQKLDKSIEAYKQSLRMKPDDVDAKHNLFLAQKMQQQQQQQQNQDKNNQDQQKKDDQNKNKDQQKDDQNQNQDQDQQKQKENKDQQKNGQEQQISKQDAERLLEAMEQDEKKVMKKVQDQKALVRKVPVEKEW